MYYFLISFMSINFSLHIHVFVWLIIMVLTGTLAVMSIVITNKLFLMNKQRYLTRIIHYQFNKHLFYFQKQCMCGALLSDTSTKVRVRGSISKYASWNTLLPPTLVSSNLSNSLYITKLLSLQGSTERLIDIRLAPPPTSSTHGLRKITNSLDIRASTGTAWARGHFTHTKHFSWRLVAVLAHPLSVQVSDP